MTSVESTRADDGDGAVGGIPVTAPDEGAPGGRPAGRLRRLGSLLAERPVGTTLAVAALAHVLWFMVFANSGGDLAAQDAWAEFVGQNPDSAYNLAWYGGMHPVSYSVISPHLMSVLGVRTTMMIAGTLSCGLLALILARGGGVKRPLLPALVGTFGLLCNAISGRVTFGLGLMFALAAVAVVFCRPRNRPPAPARWYGRGAAAALLAGLATAGSPVAGLFVGVVAAALFLTGRRPAAFALGITPCLVVGASALFFPFSGTQPMSLGTASLPVLFSVIALLCSPKRWRTVRVGAAIYALGVLLTWAVDSQVGSNVTRVALLFAGAAFAAALPWAVPRSRPWYALVVALVGVTTWQSVKTVDDIVHTRPAASWARQLAPLVDQLKQVDAHRGRVEVVPARSHREASALAPYVNLARGWNRQADTERNPLFYDGSLTPESYHLWLKRWAVRYVVLPAGEPDGAAVAEAKIVTDRQPYLEQIWSNANWKLYRVADPTPLADPPAVVERAEAGKLTLTVPAAGEVLIRVAYSPWLGLVDEKGNGVEPPEPRADGKGFDNRFGCLTQAPEDASGDEWTRLHAPRAGTYRLAAPYQLPRGTACPR
ncbi:MFS transporter [Streptomyces sp. URMC 123]|uniref:MFS transporter n=1 Tax=Streptomyces sp. URMC 123 TaxID=3423403 RepID=UPI003F1E2DCA